VRRAELLKEGQAPRRGLSDPANQGARTLGGRGLPGRGAVPTARRSRKGSRAGRWGERSPSRTAEEIRGVHL